MNEGLIPRRYAKALYEVAAERKDDSRIFQLMQTLCHSFDTVDGLKAAVVNPFVADTEKDRLIDTAAGATADDSTFADFLKLLAENRRLAMIHEIALAYCDIYRKEHNIRRVTVVSAAPLDPAVEKRIKELISANLDGGTMEYSASVNPDLIGGFIVNIDNEQLDASLRDEFKQLRLSLLNK